MPDLRILAKLDREFRLTLPVAVRKALEIEGKENQVLIELNGPILTLVNADHIRVVLPQAVSTDPAQ